MTQAFPAVPAVDQAIYDAALNAVARHNEAARGRVRLSGRDRAELLQRLTTNDINKLRAGDGARTVLINHNARILDLLTVYALPEHLLIMTNPDQGGSFARFMQGKIFFNDQVTVENITDQTIQWTLYGPGAADLIHQLTSIEVGAWPIHHVQAASISGAAAWIARALPVGGDGFTIVAEQAAADAIEQALAAVPVLDNATLDVLRIEQGYPAPRRELSTEYIPLETGLNDAISFTKGCYVGQEIIARMESRNRLAKRLMGVRITGDAQPGVDLLHDGKQAGDLTSVAHSPRFGLIGLAYVRTAVATPGTIVQLGGIGSAEVVELPFQS